MLGWMQKQKGFTIVELLIVIVVIAILAAISVVAYTGVQNRASDSAISNDLTNLAKKIHLASADTGEFPAGGATKPNAVDSSTGNSGAFPGISFAPTKSAYMAAGQNLFYCTGTHTTSGQRVFRLLARSVSGNAFMYESAGGLRNLGDTTVGTGGACRDFEYPYTWSYGYYHHTTTWNGWTNG